MPVTEKLTSFDIAQRAGVSQPTVSRALRGDPAVSEATRLRVQAIATQMNYAVDKRASSLRRGQSNTLALLLFEDPTPDDSHINPFFLAMLGSITRACSRRGYDLLVSFQQLSSDWHAEYEDSRKADGIILLGYGDYQLYRAKLAQLGRQGTRFVRWGSVDAGQPGATIGTDNAAGGRMAAEHLIAAGRQRIAFLGDASPRYPEFRDRWRGVAQALAAAGLPRDSGLTADAISTEESGYKAAIRLLRRGVPFNGLVAASDLIAVGALRALAEHGRRVPEDVAVTGYDDIPAASLCRPSLTTVAQDCGAAGTMLVDALIAQVQGRAGPSGTLPPHLVVRGSTAR